MCKHKYIPLDIFAMQDAKIEALTADHGLAGWGVYTALLLKLAQQDESGYSYPNNAKRLANILPKRPRAEVVRSTIEDYGLFEIEVDEDGVEVFYSPRLTSHLSSLGGVERKQSDEPASKKRNYNVSQSVKESLAKARAAKSSRKVDDDEEKVESKVDAKTTKVEKVETKVDESREGASTLPSTFSSTLGGTIGGVINTPLKEKDKEKVEIESSPLTPGGGIESERIELEAIEDTSLRSMVSSLMYPSSDMRDYGKVWKALYEEATAGEEDFAKPMVLSRAICRDGQELFFALMPDRPDGNSKERPTIATTLNAIALFKKMLEEAKASTFLRGNKAMANLSWLVRADNFAKVVEGCYRDNHASKPSSPPPASHGYSNDMWAKKKAEQASREDSEEVKAYKAKTAEMARRVMSEMKTRQ